MGQYMQSPIQNSVKNHSNSWHVLANRAITTYVRWFAYIASLSTTPWWYMEKWRCSSTFLDLGTRRRWVVSFMLRPLCPREDVPSTHGIGGWLGTRVDLDCREHENRAGSFQPVARRYTDWATLTLCTVMLCCDTILSQVYLLEN
jgi:hypothetical protein